MKRIIIDDNDCNTIRLSDVNENKPIFAKLNDEFIGMIVNEGHRGWILRTGGAFGATGHHPTLKECLESCLRYKYEFLV